MIHQFRFIFSADHPGRSQRPATPKLGARVVRIIGMSERGLPHWYRYEGIEDGLEENRILEAVNIDGFIEGRIEWIDSGETIFTRFERMPRRLD